jgi:ABC-type cobalamin/Fe3+-siderophores transport system ATPase subunit
MTNSTTVIAPPKGTIHVVIGPNGYGKTTFLNEERARIKKAGQSVFFIPSEIKLLDEVKDTVDSSQTMEFLLTELLETPDYVAKRTALYDEADRIISDNVSAMNAIIDGVLELNGSSRSKDFIAPNSKRVIKNLISINQDDIKKKMGSGQRMQLLLKLAANSSRDNIFLDEPEKYSHPSLLNGTAMAINEIVASGKNVYIATHSPKLISMLDIDFTDVQVINDATHAQKPIPFDNAVSLGSTHFNIGAMEAKFKRYYASGCSLRESIQSRHNRQFVEALFSKRVYLCEGANDELLINEALRQHGGYYEDYCVFKTWGKTNIPVFAYLFDSLGIEVIALYDKDDETKPVHKEANAAIRSLPSSVSSVEMDPCLESLVAFKGKKGDALALMDHLESIKLDPMFDLAKL